MNITADLVAFFTLKNRRLNDDRFSKEDEEDGQEDPDSIQTSTTPKTYSLFEPSSNYLLGGYLSLIVVISVMANVLVIIVMSLRKRKFKSTHIFIVALAVSDTLFSLAIHPMLIATSFGINPHELFGEYGCNWYGFGAVLFGSLSMLVHGTVAFTRYRVIVHSSDDFWHKKRHNFLMLAAIIAAAFSVAIAPVLGWGRYETFEYGCTLAFHDPSFNQRSYSLFAMILMMTIPLSLCIYCYTRIICFTYQCKLELFMTPQGENDSLANTDPIEGFDPEAERQKTEAMMRQVDPNLMAAVSLMERKLTRLTLVAALGFMMAWLPFALLCFWEMVSPPDEIPAAFRVIACLFCKTATAYNPFIYFFMGKEFRDDCRCVLEQLWFTICRRGQLPSDEIYMGETLCQDDQRKISHPRLDRTGKFRQAIRAGSSSGHLQDTVLTAKVVSAASAAGIIENPFNERRPSKMEHLKMERRHSRQPPAEKSNSSDDIMETIFADLNEFDATFTASCKDQQQTSSV